MTGGSIYSGAIDAFGYAMKQVGISLKWQVEKNYDAHKYLKQNYPDATRYFNDDRVGKENLERVDIICSSDPCQPNSNSGKRLGKDDHRYRWPQNFRIIRELRPNWIVNENVVGSISNMVLDQKISDLESIGYSCQPYNIPAIAVGAHHERGRLFLVAHSNAQRWSGILPDNVENCFKEGTQAATLDAQGNAFLQFEQRFGEPAIFSMDNGISDHIFRLSAAGDSIVSPIPIIILKGIVTINEAIQWTQ